VIVDHLPWTNLYNAVFSAPVLPILLLISFIIWAARAVKLRTIRKGIALLLPALYILAACIFSDKGENMRFKFWLEPIMVVFLVSQIHAVARLLHKTARLRLTTA
jgi:multisubunit Na+/H+ antiporter MnhF subunit